jgi:hypothetical protein
LWHPNTDLEKTSTVSTGPNASEQFRDEKHRAFAVPVRHALMSEMRIEVSKQSADEK